MTAARFEGAGAVLLFPDEDAALRAAALRAAVRVAVHRLRKRYRQLLRDEIAQTLSDPAQVDEELRALFGAFGS